jgi:hypothetical protein
MIMEGYAVAFHGYPSFTKDIDIFFDCSVENVFRLRAALVAFGIEESDLLEEAFATKSNILTFGVAPSRVDLVNDIDGVPYAEARPNTVRGHYGAVEVSFIGLADLVRNKQSTTGAQDKADLQELTRQDE